MAQQMSLDAKHFICHMTKKFDDQLLIPIIKSQHDQIWQIFVRIIRFNFWIVSSKFWSYTWNNPAGKSLYRGKGMVPDVQLSTNYGLGWFWIMKNIFQWSNSQFYSWLTTAHAIPSLSPCIEISLNQVTNSTCRTALASPALLNSIKYALQLCGRAYPVLICRCTTPLHLRTIYKRVLRHENIDLINKIVFY